MNQTEARPRALVEDGNLWIWIDRIPDFFSHLEKCRSIPGARFDANRKAWRYPATQAVGATIAETWGKDGVQDLGGLSALSAAAERMDAAQHCKSGWATLPAVPNEVEKSWLHQKGAHWFAQDLDSCYLAMAMGPQPLDAKVLTPTGFVEIGGLRAGDSFISDDGFEKEIQSIIDIYNPQLVYSVTFSDGSKTRCAANHLWSVFSPGQKYRGVEPRILSLSQIIESGLRDINGNSKFFIPIINQAHFGKKQELPINPYVLGLLLGDGSFTQGSVTFSKPDEEITNALSEHIRNRNDGLRLKRYASSRERCPLFGISRECNSGKNPLVEDLRSLDLMGKRSEKKFIPNKYLLSSPDDRLAVLQGLCDTDGYVEKCMNSVEYTTSSPALAEDVKFIVRSLGGRITHVVRSTKCLPSNRMMISLPGHMMPFRHGMKAKRFSPRQKYFPHRSIVSIEPIGEENVRCIQVGGNGLYITDDFIVTHNCGKSKAAIDIIRNRQSKKTLVLSPLSVVSVWPRQVATHWGDDPPRVLALNSGLVNKKAARLREMIDGDSLIAVINYDSAWREPLRSILLKQKWDAVVFDEHHKSKGPGTKTSLFASALRNSAKFRIALSGTPMPKDLLDLYAQLRALDPGLLGTSFVKFRNEHAVMGGYQNKQVVRWQNVEKLMRRVGKIMFRVETPDELDLPPATFIPIEVELSAAERRVYRQMKDSLVVDLKSGESVSSTNVLSKLLRLQQLAGGYIHDRERNEFERFGSSKEEILLDLMTDMNEPVVVCCRFREDLRAVQRCAEKLNRKYGEVSGERKDVAGTWDGDEMVLGVQIQSGGLGIDLTRARLCVLYSTGYSLGDYEQFLARVLRPGQKRPVTYYHMVCKGTVEEAIEASLRAKKNVIEFVQAMLMNQSK